MDEVVFGRFRLIGVIGDGGMGKPDKAHGSMIGHRAAVKLLPTEPNAEQGHPDRFRRKAHIVARSTEQHVVPIHHFGKVGRRLFLGTSAIDGIDLSDLLAFVGPISRQRAVTLNGSTVEPPGGRMPRQRCLPRPTPHISPALRRHFQKEECL